jgi:hypothetical protein
MLDDRRPQLSWQHQACTRTITITTDPPIRPLIDIMGDYDVPRVVLFLRERWRVHSTQLGA